jgi:hypothetical protein
MTLGQKYELGIYDIWKVPWTVKFYFPDYVGSITQLIGGEEPIEFEFQNESDSVFDIIKPSQVKICIKVRDANFILAEDLYFNGSMHCYVEIFHDEDSDDNLFWAGYIDPKQISEPYDVLPYDLVITCVDGLSLLSEIPYYDTIEDVPYDSGEPFNGRMFKSQVLLDILNKIGYSEFKEFINVYEDIMDNTINDSPLDQAEIDVDVLQDKNCDEALKDILKVYNASIEQIDGIICIYRRKELINNPVYGRHFTGVSTKISITFNPNQYIHRRGINETSLKQISGGTKLIQDPIQKVKVIQDYGYKDSWLDNWDFSSDTFLIDTFQFWEYPNPLFKNSVPVGNIVNGEKSGVLVRSTYINQLIENNLKISTTDLFIVEFDYAFFNSTGSVATDAIIFIRITQGTKQLKIIDDINYEWQTTEDFPLEVFTIKEDASEGWSGWKTFRRQFTGLEATTPIEVRLEPYITDVDACYNNVKIYATSTQILQKQVKRKLIQRIKEHNPTHFFFGGYGPKYQIVEYREPTGNIVQHEYIKENNTKGGEIQLDYLFGDVTSVSTPSKKGDVNIENVLAQFAGAISINDGSSVYPSMSWSTRDDAQAKPILELIGDEIAEQHSRSKHFLTGFPIQELSAELGFSKLGNLQDARNQYGGVNRIFIMNRGSFKVRRRLWELDLIELIQPTAANLVIASIINTPTENYVNINFNTTVHVDNTGGTSGGGTIDWKIVNGSDGIIANGQHVSGLIVGGDHKDCIIPLTCPNISGTYYVKCKMSSDSSWISSSAIIVYATLGGSISSQTNAGYLLSDGEVIISGSGGKTPYEYKIGTGAYQSSGTFSGLSAGYYTVTVKDDIGGTHIILVTITQASKPWNVIVDNGYPTKIGAYATMQFDYTGIALTARFSIKPHSTWEYTDRVLTGNENNVQIVVEHVDAISIGSEYKLEVEYPVSSDTWRLEASGYLTAAPADLEVSSVTTDSPILISTSFNASVLINNIGETAGSETINWKIVNGADVTQSSGNHSSGTIAGGDYEIHSVGMTTPSSSGTYYVKCKMSSDSSWISSSAITVYATLGGSISSQTNCSTYGGADGEVTVAGSEGISPYEYKIGSGAYQSSGTFSGLSAGGYTVTVRDVIFHTHEVPVTITQPDPVVPDPPSNFVVSQNTPGEHVSCSWTSVYNATSYQVWRQPHWNGSIWDTSYYMVYSGSDLGFDDDIQSEGGGNPADGTHFYYRVKACNDDGCSTPVEDDVYWYNP